ncbi:MAG TPA: 2-amino-4-hydroxy-6-hydroxymethyldihydropteridine diphosphokinase [Anaerolineales bacterium]|nr:2-amino-4-hydroxy-6-hydroxymethyldihydropteridine diphosphokinase [Anaerolineales bacterium]
MDERHRAYLSLGSNIQPEVNLLKAIELLSEQVEILKVSSAWETKSVGAEGPNYLNACVLVATSWGKEELKINVLRPIEARLGRVRSEDKYAPRTMDIDIILFDDRAVEDESVWETAFVVVPLAEIYPEYRNPLTGERLIDTATRLRKVVWVEARRGVLSQFSGSRFKG